MFAPYESHLTVSHSREKHAEGPLLSFSSDMFCFGVVLLELLCGQPADDPTRAPRLLWVRCYNVRTGEGLPERCPHLGRPCGFSQAAALALGRLAKRVIVMDQFAVRSRA